LTRHWAYYLFKWANQHTYGYIAALAAAFPEVDTFIPSIEHVPGRPNSYTRIVPLLIQFDEEVVRGCDLCEITRLRFGIQEFPDNVAFAITIRESTLLLQLSIEKRK
jgi:hypothetical protein